MHQWEFRHHKLLLGNSILCELSWAVKTSLFYLFFNPCPFPPFSSSDISSLHLFYLSTFPSPFASCPILSFLLSCSTLSFYISLHPLLFIAVILALRVGNLMFFSVSIYTISAPPLLWILYLTSTFNFWWNKLGRFIVLGLYSYMQQLNPQQ